MGEKVKPSKDRGGQQPSGPEPMVLMQPEFELEWDGASALAAECVLNVYVLAELIEMRSVAWVRDRGIPSLSAFNVLTVLDGAQEPLQPSLISERVMVTRGTMTGILGTLESHRLVSRTRHGEDGRAQMISLTERGREVVNELMPRVHAAETQLMSCLSRAQQQDLRALVARVQEAARSLALPPAGTVMRRSAEAHGVEPPTSQRRPR